MKKLSLVLLSILIGMCAYGQETENAVDTLRKDALNVFMEASDYIKKEIPYINYVRDIRDADVYIIRTAQPTGSGGYEGTYYLVGQQKFAGMSDTISFNTMADETEDGRRQKQIASQPRLSSQPRSWNAYDLEVASRQSAGLGSSPSRERWGFTRESSSAGCSTRGGCPSPT